MIFRNNWKKNFKGRPLRLLAVFVTVNPPWQQLNKSELCKRILSHYDLHLNMPYIPQEILDIIIGYAMYYPNLFNRASFVSQTFRQIILPYKFRSLTFWNGIRENLYHFPSRTTVIPIPKFCEAINAGDAHALSLTPLVRSWVFPCGAVETITTMISCENHSKKS